MECTALISMDKPKPELLVRCFTIKDVNVALASSGRSQARYNSPLGIDLRVVQWLLDHNITKFHYLEGHSKKVYVTSVKKIDDNSSELRDKTTTYLFLPFEHWRVFDGLLPYDVPDIVTQIVLEKWVKEDSQEITQESSRYKGPFIPYAGDNDPLIELSQGWG